MGPLLALFLGAGVFFSFFGLASVLAGGGAGVGSILPWLSDSDGFLSSSILTLCLNKALFSSFTIKVC